MVFSLHWLLGGPAEELVALSEALSLQIKSHLYIWVATEAFLHGYFTASDGNGRKSFCLVNWLRRVINLL